MVARPASSSTERAAAVGLWRSIGARLLLAFLVVAAATAGIGLSAIEAIEHTGQLVARTYDKPLMAINFARSALYDFSAMERALARSQVAATDAVQEKQAEHLAHFYNLFREDIEVARERSLSERSVRAIDEITGLVGRWQTLGVASMREGIGDDEWHALDALQSRIADRFELLIDLTAGDGFLIRQDALDTIKKLRASQGLAAVGVLLLAVLIAFYLGRTIARPLSQAAAVAERIAEGDLGVNVPQRRRDETGVLLRAMETMRASLKTMMDREISERETAQSRLADALESSAEAFIVVDEVDRIVLTNSQVGRMMPAAADLFAPGASLREALAGAIRRGCYDASMGDVGALDARYRAARTAPHAVSEIKLANGQWLRISRSAASGGGTVVIWSDITPLKEREEKLALARDTAEAANRAKTSFLANISHELRTPLNAINGFSELIATQALGPLGNEQYREYATDILNSGIHLLEIINDILDLAKNEAGALEVRREPVDVAPVIESCARTLADQCSRAGIAFSVELPKALPSAMGDRGRIKQILLNLLSNAIKFTGDGGRVCVRAAAQDDGVRIEVVDTGIGMKPDEIPTALAPFGQIDSTLARKYEGTGLGLPLCKMLTELQGGRIDIDSVPGQGTSVGIWLPAAPSNVVAFNAAVG